MPNFDLSGMYSSQFHYLNCVRSRMAGFDREPPPNARSRTANNAFVLPMPPTHHLSLGRFPPLRGPSMRLPVSVICRAHSSWRAQGTSMSGGSRLWRSGRAVQGLPAFRMWSFHNSTCLVGNFHTCFHRYPRQM